MSTDSIIHKTLSSKIWLIPFCILLGLTKFTNCQAQAIVGRWQAISNTFYYTTEGEAKYGKKVQINSLAAMGKVLIEFKSDHTYLTTNQVNNDPKINTLEGTWSLTGAQLTVTVDPKYHPRKGHESKSSMISIIGDKLVMIENTAPNPTISKMETEYQKK